MIPAAQAVSLAVAHSTLLMGSPIGGKNKDADYGGELGDDENPAPTISV